MPTPGWPRTATSSRARLPRLERQLAKDPERLDEVPLVTVTFSESDGQTAMTVHFELPAGL